MPSETPANPLPGHRTNSETSELRDPDVRALSTAKRLATLARRSEERRADGLNQIRDQIAAGTLVVRQMTVAEHSEASIAARQTVARNGARRVHNG
jgi:hypothetical protein